MAEYQITYWRDIPSMVSARAGRRNTAKIELSARLQVAIDEAAMRLKLTGTDAYIEEWRRDEWQERSGAPRGPHREISRRGPGGPGRTLPSPRRG